MTDFFGGYKHPALHSLDAGIQAAFMPGGLVLVDMPLGHRFVDNRHGCFVGSLSLFLVSRFNRGNHFLDEGTEGCALPGIQLAAFFGLACAFSGLC